MSRSLMSWKYALLVGLSLGLAGCAGAPHQVASAHSNPKQKVETQLTVARMHEKQGQWVKARDIYRQIQQKQPDNTVACHRLGVVSARLGDYDNSTKYLLDALDRSPHDSEILTDLGYTAYLQNDTVAAEKALRQALVENPKNQRAQNNLAMTLGKDGRFDESFVAFRRVVNEAEANANLAFMHTLRGEGQLAINRYSRSVALDGKLASSSQALLQLAEMQKRLPAASTKTENAIAASPASTAVAAAPAQPAASAAPIAQVKQTVATTSQPAPQPVPQAAAPKPIEKSVAPQQVVAGLQQQPASESLKPVPHAVKESAGKASVEPVAYKGAEATAAELLNETDENALEDPQDFYIPIVK